MRQVLLVTKCQRQEMPKPPPASLLAEACCPKSGNVKARDHGAA